MMKIITKKLRWLSALGLALAVLTTSFSAQAASREDVIIGVITGTAIGYMLSENDSSFRVAYHHDFDRKKHGHKCDYRHDHGKHYRHGHGKHYKHGHDRHHSHYSYSDRHGSHKEGRQHGKHERRDHDSSRFYSAARDEHSRARYHY